ncbi:MAG: hypothetical protein HKO59_01350 [Phycisphaerales bacterium]|nr:hypothetical protein [Phycisphaerae bacterium]NNF43574.1 hypothetical protein [Phycisphaerales bacterium]NNM24626.1 hypothetical protein [Phycisphaerales bacterium]
MLQTTRCCVVLATLMLGVSTRADVIYETADPFGGPFGLIGFDVFELQSVAVRFTPSDRFALDQVGLWFMNNDFSGATHPIVTATLRTDDDTGGESVPSETIIESWEFPVSAVGWDPMLEVLPSVRRPRLEPGTHYWIVAESDAPGGLDGVWNWASTGAGFVSICNGAGCTWSPGGSGAVPATIVEGTPTGPGDVDGDGDVDFTDLLGLLAAWGRCPPPPATCHADQTGDGVIDFTDLLVVLAAWTG